MEDSNWCEEIRKQIRSVGLRLFLPQGLPKRGRITLGEFHRTLKEAFHRKAEALIAVSVKTAISLRAAA